MRLLRLHYQSIAEACQLSGIILLISTLLIALPGHAASNDALQWRQNLEQQLLQQWRQQTGIEDQASISFPGLSVEYSPSPCQRPVTIDSARPLQAGRNGIAISCDAPYWSQNLALQLHHMTPMVVLAHPVASDQLITLEDVRLTTLDAGEQTKGFYAALDDVIGLKAKRSLRPGQVLSADMVEQPDVISRRQRVRILLIQPGIRVEMPGEALASGHVGESIRVRNLQSRRIVQATVIRAGVVQVR